MTLSDAPYHIEQNTVSYIKPHNCMALMQKHRIAGQAHYIDNDMTVDAYLQRFIDAL